MEDKHPNYSVSKTRKKTSHSFHLLMGVFTCTVWWFTVWPAMILWNKFGPKKKTTTEYK